jgi:putative PIN family toxin of toxin-antitoxin system
MKVLLDTNVLISASRTPGGTAYLAYIKAITAPNQGIICQQNLDELRMVYQRKFPHMLDALEQFLSEALMELEVVSMPIPASPEETQIRDASDRPILRAALAANADILVTGDKDFLEAGITIPKIMTPAEFVRMGKK